jgi:hypothetical protein
MKLLIGDDFANKDPYNRHKIYTVDMRICSQNSTKTSLMLLKLAFILLTI